MGLCQLGCNNGKHYANNDDSCDVIIPEVQQLDIRSEGRGLFSIRLPNGTAKPGCLFGFLFKVQDVLSKNVTYIWKVRMTLLYGITNSLCSVKFGM